MNFEHIRPFVRYVDRVTINCSDAFPQKLKSYDNCIIYVRGGNLNVHMNDESYSLKKGAILTWRAGVEYTIECANANTTYIIIHFDYTDAKQITNGFRITPEPPAIFTKQRITDQTVFDDAPEFNYVVHRDSMNILEEMFLGIYSEFKSTKRHLDMRTMARMIIILSEIEAKGRKKIKATTADKTEDILDFIHSHYAENLSNSDIAARFNFHPQHLNKLIRAKTGYSIHKYIIMRRISKACEMLSTTKLPISEIGYRIGFQNSNHFTRYFKEFIYMTPGEYRKKNRI